MLGRLITNQKSVTIIGGGAAGMFAAYFLDKQGYEVSLYEASDRLGGMIHTVDTDYGIVESSANSLVGTPALFGLAEDVGVKLEELNKSSKAKYILFKGKMRKNPLNAWDMLQVVYGSLLKRAPITARNMRELGEILYGAKVTDYILEPMIAGIFGAKANEIAVAAAFPRMQIWQGMTFAQSIKMNSKSFPSSGKRMVVAPAGGMERLIHKLGFHLEKRLGSRLHLSEPQRVLPDQANVILCTPAAEASKLVRRDSSILASRLDQVTYTPMISAGVFVKEQDLRQVPRGLGVLIPPNENRQVLGILFSSASFPSRIKKDGVCLFTVMMGGSHHPELLAKGDEELGQIIQKELATLFGLRKYPLRIVIKRWPVGIPLYNDGLMQTWQTANETWCANPGRVLFGNYTGEVSLRGMVESAAKLAENLPVPIKPFPPSL